MLIDLTTNVSQNSPLIQWAKSQDNPHVAMGHIGTHLDTYEKSAIPLEYFKSSGILFDVRGIPEVTEGDVDITLIQPGDFVLFRTGRQHSEHEAADRFCEQHGIYVIENLKNMEQIHYQRFTLYTMWLEDEVMTGLRCRVIAECLE